jgi:hypothetical protein
MILKCYWIFELRTFPLECKIYAGNLSVIYVQVTMHRDKLRTKQPTRCIKKSKKLFCHKTLHVSGIFCAHHQELSTVGTAIRTFHAGHVITS